MALRVSRLGFGSACLFALAFLSAATLKADAQTDEFVQMIVKLIGDRDKEFRAAGLEQVRTAARGPALTQLFAAQLTKLDADGQIALLSALADRGDHAARAAVLDLLGSSHDENVRAGAIRSLGRLGESQDLPLLIKSLSAGPQVEQAAARRSLIEIPGETVNQALAADLLSESSSAKGALLDVLATRRASGQAPAFLAAIVDDNARVRRSAMAALGQIGRPEQIAPMLAGVLKARKGYERDAAEKNVALVCERIENPDQRGAALIEALNTVDAAHRDELLSLLGRVGGKKLIDFVAAIATGPDGARRQLGIDALSKWPDASVADTLLEIITKASDPAERGQAFRGYVKVSANRDGRSDKERLDRLKQAMKAAKTPEETTLVINRVRTAYDIDSVRFVLPYVDQPQFAQIACETIVEIAHHREVRDPNKAEMDKALDKVIATSKDAVVVERANRYKRGETWQRPSREAR
ncbi:MAG TPA: HEAT repeat domain-containing protein [Planctomycetaceae bacterium]|nr:HEAT repeat domain-containing protein [Planctomycetaceae bacterium]